jgi:hypothetical protein
MKLLLLVSVKTILELRGIPGKSAKSGFDEEFDGRCVFIDLGSHRSGTIDTEILILVPLWQNQKQFFSHRHGGLAPCAIKGSRFEFFKMGFSFFHIINYKKKWEKSQSHFFLPEKAFDFSLFSPGRREVTNSSNTRGWNWRLFFLPPWPE